MEKYQIIKVNSGTILASCDTKEEAKKKKAEIQEQMRGCKLKIVVNLSEQ